MDALKQFGPVWDGAGARGFFRDPYWFHGLVPGLSFTGSTFVAKTATTYPTAGNLPLTDAQAPREWFPKCIWVDWRRGMALNAVGLSGPGLRELLLAQRWQRIREPFFISFMPVLPLEDDRYGFEAKRFASCLRRELPHFRSRKLGIQVNLTCPNVGADHAALVGNAWNLLDELKPLGLPLIVKLNLLVTPEAGAIIARHPACDGICMGNTIPFGTVLPKPWWKRHFPKGSPLIARGFSQPGGLSGAPLLPLVVRWVRQFRELDTRTPVNAGGGILHARDVDAYKQAGADSVSIASVAMLRPWRVRSVIWRAHRLFG